MIWRKAGWLAVLLTALMSGSCQRSLDTKQVFVFGAASLGDVLVELVASFETETGQKVALNLAGSNALAQQIAFSDRADVFISADEKWMDFLESKGRISSGTRRVLLTNGLVVVAAKDSRWKMDSPTGLCDSDFRFLCIGDPDAVPVGRYAKRWLESIQCENGRAWDGVKDRVAPGTDARAVLGQTSSRRDAIGIVYRTDYLQARESVRLLFEIDSIRAYYPIALMKGSLNQEGGAAFSEFLLSEVAAEIWERHGFQRTDK